MALSEKEQFAGLWELNEDGKGDIKLRLCKALMRCDEVVLFQALIEVRDNTTIC